MTLDELARAAAAEARLAAAHQIDAMTMLAELRHRSRRRTAAAAIAVVAAVCVAVVVALLMVGPGKPTSTRPASTEHPHPSSTSASACRGGPPIQCLSGRRVLVSLPVPVTVHVPTNFDQNASLCGSSGLIVYRNDSYGTGVTVIENAVPVRYDSSWHRDRSAGTSVSSIAHWLSARPFFAHTSVKPVTVDGLAGRQISGELKPAAELPADYPSVGQVAPTFTGNGDCHAAAGRGLFGTYTVVQVPGAGVTVIWSWTINRDHALIAGNQPLIDGLSFG